MLYIKLFIEREKIQVNLRRSVPLSGVQTAVLLDLYLQLYQRFCSCIIFIRVSKFWRLSLDPPICILVVIFDKLFAKSKLVTKFEVVIFNGCRSKQVRSLVQKPANFGSKSCFGQPTLEPKMCIKFESMGAEISGGSRIFRVFPQPIPLPILVLKVVLAAYYHKGRIPLFQQAANLVADLRERVASRSKACRKQVATSQASCKLASNLLQTKSILAAMKKQKHSTWVKQYIRDRHRYDAYMI